jgi:hypothetical protein
LVGDRSDLAKVVPHADVAQLVEHHLAKVRVAGSNPVVRSTKSQVRGLTQRLPIWPGQGPGDHGPYHGRRGTSGKARPQRAQRTSGSSRARPGDAILVSSNTEFGIDSGEASVLELLVVLPVGGEVNVPGGTIFQPRWTL